MGIISNIDDLFTSPGKCGAEWLLAHRELWLQQVVGVGEVVFAKLESLLRVGVTNSHAFIMAWDNRILALRMEIAIRAHSKEYAAKFGFRIWVDWSKLADSWQDAKMPYLSRVAKQLHERQMEKLKYAVNNRRSKVAGQLQKENSSLVEEFCTAFHMEHNALSVHGLRETLRFLPVLQGIAPEKYNHPRRHKKQRLVCSSISSRHTGCVFDNLNLPRHRLHISTTGQVFCEMVHVLQPEDTAYWWACPGTVIQLVLSDEVLDELRNAPRAPNEHQRDCEVFIGKTADAAYGYAEAHCISFTDLVQRIVQGNLMVAAWAIEPSEKVWGFKISRISC